MKLLHCTYVIFVFIPISIVMFALELAFEAIHLIGELANSYAMQVRAKWRNYEK